MHWNSDWHMGWMALWSIPMVAALVMVLWFALSRGRRGGSAEDSPERLLKFLRSYAHRLQLFDIATDRSVPHSRMTQVMTRRRNIW